MMIRWNFYLEVTNVHATALAPFPQHENCYFFLLHFDPFKTNKLIMSFDNKWNFSCTESGNSRYTNRSLIATESDTLS